MTQKRKKVLFIDSDSEFLDQQKANLKDKNIDNYFFGFTDFWDALQFMEKQIIAQNRKLHYILLDEQIFGDQLDSSLEKIAGLKNFLKKPEIIICTNKNSDELRNHVMQNASISAFLVKPIPKNYVEFLITGLST